MADDKKPTEVVEDEPEVEVEEEENPDESGEEGEESGEDEGEEEEGLSKAEAKEAKNLYKLLKNPTTQKDVLRVLAKQAGIFQEPAETKQEVKEQKRDLKKILEEKLGPELKWLADKLTPAMEEMLEQERESRSSEITDIQTQQLSNDVVRVGEKLNRETKGDYKRLESRMSQLADKILPAPGVSVEEYCRHLYSIASSERRGNQQKSQLADKINRNASNASERIRGGTSVTDDTTKKAQAGKMGIKEAVAYAVSQQEKGNRK